MISMKSLRLSVLILLVLAFDAWAFANCLRLADVASDIAVALSFAFIVVLICGNVLVWNWIVKIVRQGDVNAKV